MQNSLTITNTFFKLRRQHTWTTPNGKSHNTIDYIMFRKSSNCKVVDTHVLNYPDISDHRPVRCKLQLNTIMKKRNTIKATVKFDVTKLDNDTTRKLFQTTVSNNLTTADLTISTNTQQLMNTIEKSVIEAASTVLGKRKSSSRTSWISDITLASIQHKRETRETYGSSSIEYTIAKATTKKMCKIDKETRIDNDHKSLGALPNNQQYFAAVKN